MTVTDFGVSSRGAVNLSELDITGVWTALRAAPLISTTGIAGSMSL